MPQLTSEQEDTVFKAISRQLRRVNAIVSGVFGQELSDEEKRAAYEKTNQGVRAALRQAEQRRNYAPLGGAPQIPARIPPEVAEGGFINEGAR